MTKTLTSLEFLIANKEREKQIESLISQILELVA
jgi:hypothetical protein